MCPSKRVNSMRMPIGLRCLGRVSDEVPLGGMHVRCGTPRLAGIAVGDRPQVASYDAWRQRRFGAPTPLP
jgi:hypothetical protein